MLCWALHTKTLSPGYVRRKITFIQLFLTENQYKHSILRHNSYIYAVHVKSSQKQQRLERVFEAHSVSQAVAVGMFCHHISISHVPVQDGLHQFEPNQAGV